jgi:hypothetical protein
MPTIFSTSVRSLISTDHHTKTLIGAHQANITSLQLAHCIAGGKPVTIYREQNGHIILAPYDEKKQFHRHLVYDALKAAVNSGQACVFGAFMMALYYIFCDQHFKHQIKPRRNWNVLMNLMMPRDVCVRRSRCNNKYIIRVSIFSV